MNPWLLVSATWLWKGSVIISSIRSSNYFVIFVLFFFSFDSGIFYSGTPSPLFFWGLHLSTWSWSCIVWVFSCVGEKLVLVKGRLHSLPLYEAFCCCKTLRKGLYWLECNELRISGFNRSVCVIIWHLSWFFSLFLFVLWEMICKWIFYTENSFRMLRCFGIMILS